MHTSLWTTENVDGSSVALNIHEQINNNRTNNYHKNYLPRTM